jgi:photosystem II stability/assembly factor-like uncharacterized protein
VNAVVVAPSNPAVIWVGSSGGVFRSTDSGATWSNVSGPLSGVVSLVVHPSDPNKAWALSPSVGLHRTVDGGTTWIDPHRELAGMYVPRLLIDPRDPDTLYAGGGCFAGIEPIFPPVYGLYKSTDGGVTWKRSTAGLFGLSQCMNEVSIDPFSPWRLFAAGPYSGVAGRVESYDGTNTWEHSTGVLPSAGVVFDSRFPFTHYGITERFGSAFLISQDGGFTWNSAATKPPAQVRSLSIDPELGRLFLGTSNGMFRSGDSGRVWANTHLPDSDVNALDFGGTQPAVFAATNQGLYEVVNRGLGESRPIDLHDIATNILAMDVDPSNPDILYAATTDSVYGGTPIHASVSYSTNGGASWQRVPGDIDVQIGQIAIDAGGTVYAATNFRGSTLYRRRRGEAKWTAVHNNTFLNAVVADPKTAGRVFVSANGIDRSLDGGDTWQNLGVSGNYLAIDASDPRWVYAAGEDHLYRSSDGGNTWSDLQPGGFINGTRGIVVAPSNGSVVYRIGANGGRPRPERSDDRGATWTAATLPGGVYPSSLAVDPLDENSIWVAVFQYGEGLFHSTDGGAHWTEVKGPVGEHVAASALRFDPRRAMLHVAYPGHGVWELTREQRRRPSRSAP